VAVVATSEYIEELKQVVEKLGGNVVVNESTQGLRIQTNLPQQYAGKELNVKSID
jgi:hypothetical protein